MLVILKLLLIGAICCSRLFVPTIADRSIKNRNLFNIENGQCLNPDSYLNKCIDINKSFDTDSGEMWYPRQACETKYKLHKKNIKR